MNNSQFTIQSLREEIDNLTILLEQEKYKAIQVERAQIKHLLLLRKGHERTKSRLLKYEDASGVTRKASRSETYLSQ